MDRKELEKVIVDMAVENMKLREALQVEKAISDMYQKRVNELEKENK